VRDDIYPIPEPAKKGTARVTQAAIPQNVDSTFVRSPLGTPSVQPKLDGRPLMTKRRRLSDTSNGRGP